MWLIVSELEGGPSLAENDDLDGGFDPVDQDSEDDENQDSDSVIQLSNKQRWTALASIENVRLTNAHTNAHAIHYLVCLTYHVLLIMSWNAILWPQYYYGRLGVNY